MGCEDGIAAESVPDPGDSGRGATSQVGEDLVGGAHHMEQEGEALLGCEADVGLEGEALQGHGDIISDIAMNLVICLENLTDIDRYTSEHEIAIIKRDMREIVELERNLFRYILPDSEE